MLTVVIATDYVSSAIAFGALVFVGVTARVILRGGGSTALDVLRTANGVLEKRVHELEKESVERASKIAVLEGKTDVTVALQPLTEALRLHDDHAKMRADAQLAAMEMIAARLGAGPLVP